MAGMELDRDEDCDVIGLGCALEYFSEVEDVMNMIDNVKNIYTSPSQLEFQYNKLYDILKQYYEQPHLLDPHLEKMLSKLLSVIKDNESPIELKHTIFDYMYQIIRIRGYKVVVRYLPHEVSDLLMVLTLLESQSPSSMYDNSKWRSKFVLLLWLSIVVIIPFHMSRLDGFAPGETDTDNKKKLTVMDRIFNICKTYAQSKDACAIASAFLASKFLTRSDVKEVYLSQFFDWACELHSNFKQEDSIHYGVLAAVAAVLKHGKRDDLLPYAPKLLHWLSSQNYKQHQATLIRKYGAKIVHRIGLTYLRPRVAAWRYTRGSRSLAATLGGAAAAGDTNEKPATPVTEADDDYDDIPQEVEDVIELLLCSLRDEETLVRWSGAKGIGRIGARLPAAAAAEVAECVLGLFVVNERETVWHGACMATAELARRGLLSPEQLGKATRAVVLALQRDEPRGANGGDGGRQARDAACYVAWAFARAYDASALAPHVNMLAFNLIATACFDREIHCRRAASAAFQEHVGRHGMFPHGITVLTTADFMTVGPRNNAFLVVAPQVASLPEYAQPLIDHIVNLKIEHWDAAIRELASKALFKLTDKLPEYVATMVLTKLVAKSESMDLNIRHGSILSMGEVIYALSQTELADGKKADSLITEDLLVKARDMVSKLQSRQQFRGIGGELMRQACCQLVACLSMAQAPIHSQSAIDDWLNLIEECLSHEVPAIRDKAIYALPLVFREYLNDRTECDGVSAKEKRGDLMQKYCEQLDNTGVNGLQVRMGYARAVGSLPKFALQEYLPTVIESLVKCSKVTDTTSKWAEARRDAVVGLADVCQTVGIKGGVEQYMGQITEALLESLSEYTVDERGDIGALVREASMSSLLSLCRQCAIEAPHLNTPEVINNVMCGLAQQTVEKIDRTRAHAGKIFTSFIYNVPQITNIPQVEDLKRIFPWEELDLKPPTDEEGETKKEANASESSKVIEWLFPGHTMPRFVQLLKYPEYRYSLIKGLIISAGDLSESLVKHTTQSLNAYLFTLHDDMETLSAICDTIVKVFADNLHVKRVTKPIMSFLDRLLGSGSISPILEDEQSQFAMEIFKHVRLELTGFNTIYNIVDSISVLCQLIQVGGEVCMKCLNRLVIYLCHSHKFARRSASTRLYEAFTLYGDMLQSPNIDEVMSILAETDWEKEVSELRPIRNKICDLLGIKPPMPKPKTATST